MERRRPGDSERFVSSQATEGLVPKVQGMEQARAFWCESFHAERFEKVSTSSVITRSRRQRVRLLKPKSCEHKSLQTILFQWPAPCNPLSFRLLHPCNLVSSIHVISSSVPFSVTILFFGPLASCFEFGVSEKGSSIWDLATKKAWAPEFPTRVLKFPA